MNGFARVGRCKRLVAKRGYVKTIQSLFLTLKHWHIFVLFFVLPEIVGFIGIGSMRIKLFMAVTVLFIACLLAWYWSVGSFLSSAVVPKFRMKAGFFHFAVLYPLLYISLVFWFLVTYGDRGWAVIIPLHLFAMFCMFYVLYFVSKNMVTAETGKPALLPDYIGALMLFWFFPIGVWFIQPRVNQIYRRVAV